MALRNHSCAPFAATCSSSETPVTGHFSQFTKENMIQSWHFSFQMRLGFIWTDTWAHKIRDIRTKQIHILHGIPLHDTKVAVRRICFIKKQLILTDILSRYCSRFSWNWQKKHSLYVSNKILRLRISPRIPCIPSNRESVIRSCLWLLRYTVWLFLW
jgi:hypothetical protein